MNKIVVVRERVVHVGYGLGSVLAVVVSWTVNKSVAWAAVHFLFGWFYIMYACCAHADRLDAAVSRSVETIDKGQP